MNDASIPPAPAPRKKGCLFYGCLTVALLTLALGLAAFFTARYALRRVTAVVEQYTDTRPAALPEATMTEEEFERLKQRLADFQETVENRKPGEALTLTADDLNGLIARHPAMQAWKDRLRVTIDQDQVKGQVSIPLAEVANVPGLAALRGRYLNGSATLKVSLENGLLDVHILSLEVKGAPLPEEVMGALRAENLAKDAAGDPQAAEALQRLGRLEVRDGAVMLSPQPPDGLAESP